MAIYYCSSIFRSMCITFFFSCGFDTIQNYFTVTVLDRFRYLSIVVFHTVLLQSSLNRKILCYFLFFLAATLATRNSHCTSFSSLIRLVSDTLQFLLCSRVSVDKSPYECYSRCAEWAVMSLDSPGKGSLYNGVVVLRQHFITNMQ